MGFAFDTSKPAPGPYRLPYDNERRTRIYFEHPFRDCTTVCEMSPDLEEATDATMRLFAASWEMRKALARLLAAKDEKDLHGETDRYRALKDGAWGDARAALAKADGQRADRTAK